VIITTQFFWALSLPFQYITLYVNCEADTALQNHTAGP